MNTSWKTFLLRVAVLSLAIGVTIRVALARDGVPSGRSRSFVTIAGTVTGAGVTPGARTMMRFTFHEPASAMRPMGPCMSNASVDVATNGEFVAEVPTEGCVEALFDGRDVQVDVNVGGVDVVTNQAVNPVPYAIHADQAAAAAPDSGLGQQLAAVANASPPGTLVAFAGAGAGGNAPAGWLWCDGRAVSRTTYASLFAAIGTAWGAGDGATTFNLPDLRGRFLRGVDGDAGRDPDRDTRIATTDGGNSGNAVGSVQDHQFARHGHNLDVAGGLGTGSGTGRMAIAYFSGPPNLQEYAQPRGGSETRPVNAAVNFIIRY